jgi:hypothetical protein
MTKRYFTTFQLVLLALFSALVPVAKISLRLPIQLPGHTGLFWMAIILVGSKVVPQRGASAIMGTTSGLIAAFLGMGDFGALNTFLSYTAVGVCTELALLLLGDSEHVLILSLAGIFGHLGKFLVKYVLGIITGAPVGLIALGLLRAILGYVIFGALGGLLAGLTLVALRRAGFFSYLAEKR